MNPGIKAAIYVCLEVYFVTILLNSQTIQRHVMDVCLFAMPVPDICWDIGFSSKSDSRIPLVKFIVNTFSFQVVLVLDHRERFGNHIHSSLHGNGGSDKHSQAVKQLSDLGVKVLVHLSCLSPADYNEVYYLRSLPFPKTLLRGKLATQKHVV